MKLKVTSISDAFLISQVAAYWIKYDAWHEKIPYEMKAQLSYWHFNDMEVSKWIEKFKIKMELSMKVKVSQDKKTSFKMKVKVP